MYAANVEGTRNVLTAARNAGVPTHRPYQHGRRTWDPARTRLGREDTPVALDDMVGPYKRSKFMAEQEVFEAAREGAPGGDRESLDADRRRWITSRLRPAG